MIFFQYRRFPKRVSAKNGQGRLLAAVDVMADIFLTKTIEEYRQDKVAQVHAHTIYGYVLIKREFRENRKRARRCNRGQKLQRKSLIIEVGKTQQVE